MPFNRRNISKIKERSFKKITLLHHEFTEDFWKSFGDVIEMMIVVDETEYMD